MSIIEMKKGTTIHLKDSVENVENVEGKLIFAGTDDHPVLEIHIVSIRNGVETMTGIATIAEGREAIEAFPVFLPVYTRLDIPGFEDAPIYSGDIVANPYTAKTIMSEMDACKSDAELNEYIDKGIADGRFVWADPVEGE